MPLMQLKVVVLPAPFGPISPQICRSSTSKETPATAVTPPKRTTTSRTSSNAIPSATPVRTGPHTEQRQTLAVCHRSLPSCASCPFRVRRLHVLAVAHLRGHSRHHPTT